MFLASLLALAVPAGAADSTPAPRDRLYYSNSVFVRGNPLGLVDIARVGWQRRLSDKDSLLLQDTYTFVGPTVMLTPAYARFGAYGEAQVLSVLRVFASVEGVGYFGTFDQVLSFPSADVRYSDQAIETLGAANQAAPRLGWVTNIGITLRAAVGPIAIRTTPQVTRFDLALPDGDAFFYDQYWDRLAPDQAWMVLTDTDVLWLAEKVRLGLRHTFSDHLDGTKGAAGMAQHRLGPLFAFQFRDDAPGARTNQPTLFVLSQWWLQHPYRTGQEQPLALPLLALGFAVNGDLWTSAD